MTKNKKYLLLEQEKEPPSISLKRTQKLKTKESSGIIRTS
jgi:hypothetical protein